MTPTIQYKGDMVFLLKLFETFDHPITTSKEKNDEQYIENIDHGFPPIAKQYSPDGVKTVLRSCLDDSHPKIAKRLFFKFIIHHSKRIIIQNVLDYNVEIMYFCH